MTINSTDNFKIQKVYGKISLYGIYIQKVRHHLIGKELIFLCKENSINAFSSPFDTEGIKVLENLKCPIYKTSFIRKY